MKIVDVPLIFRQPQQWKFPPHQQGPHIEEFALEYFKYYGGESEYEYLPCFYSAWYHNHNADRECMKLMDDFIRSLPKGKYFTVCRLANEKYFVEALKEIGCLVFGAAGWGDVAIPLPCDKHMLREREFKRYENPHFLASFVGSFGTHPIREKMKQVFEECHFTQGRTYITFAEMLTEAFMHITADSYFTLCPRGYGRTSFRLYEALQIGSIPVYIFDDQPWLPFGDKVNWLNLAILCPINRLDILPEVLNNKPIERIEEMRTYGTECYEKYFTPKGICEEILNILKERK